MAQIDPSKPCKECYVKYCDCTCETCVGLQSRNRRLSKLDLTRLNIAAGLAKSGVGKDERKRIGRMLRGMGL